ncbi:hypothetical protein BDV95DRAFT_628405 [Massariosphaeria phaeospora]|uniref:Core domain-containing protein n=1 Tax=Massariosphaeria phaeospora TaxID=100035 RepID=A0A7C8M920_9PLEO|nr:hypothetical protein BDV95DRAFT_628405 [Massariosphaeria phaeospora]
MASPSTLCASCFRAAQRAPTRSAVRSRRLIPTQLRAYHATAATSLYLDFLAPSTQRTALRSTSALIPSFSPSSRSQPTPRRTLATASTSQPAHAIQNPRTTEDGVSMTISLSPRAANRLSAISNTDKNPALALRIAVESGGCHGFQYLMSLIDMSKVPPTEEDTVFEGDKGAKVVIDEASLELLHGSTVDYTMELIGSQFIVTGIPGATSSCGCGTSFDIQI